MEKETARVAVHLPDVRINDKIGQILETGDNSKKERKLWAANNVPLLPK